MINKKTALVGVLVLLALIMPSAVHALAVAPATLETDFYSKQSRDYTFEIINNADLPIDVELSTNEEFEDYVTFKDKKFTMTPWQSKIASFSVKFPKDMDLPNMIPIRATTPIKTTTGATLNAKVALELRLLVRGEHTAVKPEAEELGVADIDIIDVALEKAGEQTATLNIKVKNVGTLSTDVSAEVNIGTGADRQFVVIDSVKVDKGKIENLVSEVNIPDIEGYYDAEITLRFADKIKKETFKLQVIQPAEPNIAFYAAIIGLIILNISLIGLVIRRIKRQNR